MKPPMGAMVEELDKLDNGIQKSLKKAEEKAVRVKQGKFYLPYNHLRELSKKSKNNCWSLG